MTTSRIPATTPHPSQPEEVRRMLVAACHVIVELCAETPGAPVGLASYAWVQVPYMHHHRLDDVGASGAVGSLETTPHERQRRSMTTFNQTVVR